MIKPLRKSQSADSSRRDLDTWLFSAELDQEELALLASYRTAAEELRLAATASKPTMETKPPIEEALSESAADAEDASGIPSSEDSAEGRSRGLPAVPRLSRVDGIEPASLSGLHGRLVADGLLMVEILGRSDGLAYRITRDGLRRLNGDAGTAEAA